MIQSFRHKGLKRLFEKADRSKVPAQHVQKLERILAALNLAAIPDDMDFPGFDLHPLKGAFRGFWSVTVSGNWRVVFRIQQGYVHDVDFADYH